jgi:protein-disulfide isomerase
MRGQLQPRQQPSRTASGRCTICSFHRQKALEDDNLQRYAVQLELDVAHFDRDRSGADVQARIRRDVKSGLASGHVRGTPTLFIDGVVHRGGYDPPALLAALAP